MAGHDDSELRRNNIQAFTDILADLCPKFPPALVESAQQKDRPMKKRFTDEQIISILKEQEAGERTSDVCRRHGISQATFYKYKAKYGGMAPSDARKLKALESENAKLKKLLAEQMLDNAMLRDVNSKKW